MAWTFDRTRRLEALVDRAARLARYLQAESLDAPRGSADRETLRRRLATVEGRLARLRMLARTARYNARELAR